MTTCAHMLHAPQTEEGGFWSGCRTKHCVQSLQRYFWSDFLASLVVTPRSTFVKGKPTEVNEIAPFLYRTSRLASSPHTVFCTYMSSACELRGPQRMQISSNAMTLTVSICVMSAETLAAPPSVSFRARLLSFASAAATTPRGNEHGCQTSVPSTDRTKRSVCARNAVLQQNPLAGHERQGRRRRVGAQEMLHTLELRTLFALFELFWIYVWSELELFDLWQGQTGSVRWRPAGKSH